jgi:hypothetical protein
MLRREIEKLTRAQTEPICGASFSARRAYMVGAVPTLGVMGKLPTNAQTNCERPYWYSMYCMDAWVGLADTMCIVSSPPFPAAAVVSDAKTASMSMASENRLLSGLSAEGRRSGLADDIESDQADAAAAAAWDATGTSSSLDRLGTLFLRAAPCSEQRIRYKKDRASVVSMPSTTDFQWILPRTQPLIHPNGTGVAH